jgi:2'-5' RNA ligase
MQEGQSRYFLEDWVRGAKGPTGALGEVFSEDDPSHPHITFVRPFSIPLGKEEEIKDLIIGYCKDRQPIDFKLKGRGSFSGKINYIPVESAELLEFNNGLEKILEGKVDFDEKLSDQKILHLTVTSDKFEDFPESKLPMLRLTCIRDKKIWFSWDFEQNKELNREESLVL